MVTRQYSHCNRKQDQLDKVAERKQTKDDKAALKELDRLAALQRKAACKEARGTGVHQTQFFGCSS